MFHNISPPNKNNGITDILTATSNEPLFNSRLVQKSEMIISFIQDMALAKRIPNHDMCRMVLERIIDHCNLILNSNFFLASTSIRSDTPKKEE